MAPEALVTEQHNNLAVFSFREVPGGFIYRAPNPRVFGKCDHYFVSAAQRDEILTAMPTAPSPTVVGCLVGGFTLALVVPVIALNLYFPGFQTTIWVVFSVLVGCLALLALHLLAKRALRSVQPIIETAPRTDQQITLADIQAAQATQPSVTYEMQKRGCKLTAIASAASLFAAFAMVMDRNASLFETPALIFGCNAVIFAILTLTGLCALKQRKAAENATTPTMVPKVDKLSQRLVASLGLALLAYLLIAAVVGVRSEFSDQGFGQRAEKRGDHKSAIVGFSKALEAAPGNKVARMGRARSFIATGQNVQAIADLTLILEVEPANADAYRWRGQANRAAGRDDSAIADYTRVLELDPADPYANYFRGVSYAAKKDWDLAIADFTRAIAAKANDHFAYVARARNFQAKGDLDSAIADVNKAIGLNPKYGNAYLLRARLYTTKGATDLALADYSMAIQIAPNDTGVLANRAGFYEHVGKVDLAVEDYKAMLALPATAPADTQRQEQARKSIARLIPTAAGSPTARDTRP